MSSLDGHERIIEAAIYPAARDIVRLVLHSFNAAASMPRPKDDIIVLDKKIKDYYAEQTLALFETFISSSLPAREKEPTDCPDRAQIDTRAKNRRDAYDAFQRASKADQKAIAEAALLKAMQDIDVDGIKLCFSNE